MSKRKKTTNTMSEKAPGRPVLYWGMGTTQFQCSACPRSFRKGIYFEHNHRGYCSHGCVKAHI